MFEILIKPWPWYVSGPLIGLMVPLLYIIGNKAFGISTNFRHICAICFSSSASYFSYDWKKEGTWQLLFVAGIILGAFLASSVFENASLVAISTETKLAVAKMGILNQTGLIPPEVFNWSQVFTFRGFVMMIIGGFLVGFGTRYADGCTSGHTISGLSNLQFSSVIASVGFFIGGLIVVHFVYPILF